MGLNDSDSWNDIADDYAAWTARHLRPYSEQAVQLAELEPAHHVLDVACGPGTLTALVAPLVARVEAVDFAPRMVAHCRANTPDNVHAQVADGHALPFADGAFDRAFSMFGLAFFDDRLAALGELHRVLKPGGRVFVSSWVPFDQSPAMARMGPVMRTLDPDLQPPDGIPMNNEAVIREEFESAGFTDVDVRPLPGELIIDDIDEMWDRFVAGNLFIRHVRATIGEQAFLQRAPVAKAKFAEGLEPGQRISQPALLGVGRR